MSQSNRERRQRRTYYRAGTRSGERHVPALPSASSPAANDMDTPDASLVTIHLPAPFAQDEQAPSNDIADAPTIQLTPDDVALLAATPPPADAPIPVQIQHEHFAEPMLPFQDSIAELRSLSAEMVATQDDSPPTIVLDVHALMSSPAIPAQELLSSTWSPSPDLQAAVHEAFQPSQQGHEGEAAPEHPAVGSWPRPDEKKTRRRRRDERGYDDEFARLHRLRMARQAGEIDHLPEEPYVADKLQQWWRDVQPGIERIFGRIHRQTHYTTRLTSASLPAVHLDEPAEDALAPVRRLSDSARQIGSRAQAAAFPALQRLHDRAEKLAQGLVDRLDEQLGGAPPLQHVLVGPGRMIVSFHEGVSIRQAQMIISSVQARSLRRLVGFNAYLVIVPPGREARYAERFQSCREVTGVHFGPQRPSRSFVGKLRG